MSILNEAKLILPFAEGGGSIAYDRSGNKNHGTIVGAGWETSNQHFGPSALSLDDLDDYVHGTSAFGDVDFRNQAFGISLWAYPNASADQDPLITLGAATAGNHIVNFIYDGNNDRLLARLHQANNALTNRSGIHTASGAGLAGGWQHFMLEHDGTGTMDLARSEAYIGNVASATTNSVGSFGAFQSNSYRVGRDSGAQYYGDYIQQVIVLPRVFTAAERSFLWNGGAGRFVDLAIPRRRLEGY
ncbi:MAG: hypothetical protein KAR40_09645 [Candidatus Sabulitectum sp.]|nr:hypothetical protein [Candidatus Sabulitectum sp.]